MSAGIKPIIQTMRADKWLWCARFYKTRSQATAAIRAGRVKLNGNRIKPGREVRCEDQMELSIDGYRFVLRIVSLAKSRGPAAMAMQLYQEDADGKATRMELQQQRKLASQSIVSGERRPDKRQRRKIIAFTRKSGN